jgi:hypothetical protein
MKRDDDGETQTVRRWEGGESKNGWRERRPTEQNDRSGQGGTVSQDGWRGEAAQETARKGEDA